MNRDFIKILALLAMVGDHIAQAFMAEGSLPYMVLTILGHFTAVTMIYFLVEGFAYTRSVKNYMLRLLFFAVLAQYPFMKLFFTEDTHYLNILFSLCLDLLLLLALEKMPQGSKQLYCLAALVGVSTICDWGIMSPLFTLIIYAAMHPGWRGIRLKKTEAFYICALLYALLNINRGLTLQNLADTLGGAAAILLAGLLIVRFYNGKRMEIGKTFFKWFFYLFYPAHLMLIYLLK